MIKKKKSRCLIALIAILMFAAVWIIGTNTNIVKTQYVIKNPKIPDNFDGFKIIQVSDLHNHNWGDKLTGFIESERPDIIAVTGDLVDSSHTDFEVAMDFIDDALEIAPVYYVTGNHEAWLDNYSDLEKQLLDSGVHILDNCNQWIVKNNTKINLVGIQDPDFVERDILDGIQESIVTTVLEPLLDPNCYNIVLCHRPELFAGYVSSQADLVLAGHAHGGQIRIPFIGALIAPNQGFFPEYTEGVYHRDGTDMVVSRGLGNSIIPVRINNPPELVIITCTV